MEIRQLEYFVVSVEEKSFYRASEKLFISQPAISKGIGILEKDVGTKLFYRSNKGLKLTSSGEKLYHYAKNILRQVDIMKNTLKNSDEIELKVSSYPSHMISSAIVDFYNYKVVDLQINYREGTVQDIINFVDGGISEIGIIYISPNQEKALQHILAHKNLEFIPLVESELCVYVGKSNKLYNSNELIEVSELSNLKYIRGYKDFFSVEHHFDYVNLNEINTTQFEDKVITNSDHLVSILLEKTDLCYLGVDTKVKINEAKININTDEKQLTLGYIKNKSMLLSDTSREFLEYITKYI